jgi:hypothetical protein
VPRSEWKIKPGGGRRAPMAIRQASQTQLGAHVVGDGPAHHPARGQVDDAGQVGPALPSPDVGDVADVDAVDLDGPRPEGPLEQVDHHHLGIRDGGGGPAPPTAAEQGCPSNRVRPTTVVPREGPTVHYKDTVGQSHTRVRPDQRDHHPGVSSMPSRAACSSWLSHPHARMRRWHSSTGTVTDYNNGRDILGLSGPR